MKRFCITAVLAATISAFGCRSTLPPHTVARVDLERYLGLWYEIASFPAWFQEGCFCTQAEYRMREGYVEVVNRCRRGSSRGEWETARARAYPVPGSGDAQLKVQFFWPFRGDYWIIALDENYRWAVVGHPDKRYLWILSREPTMDEETYQRLSAEALDKGYDVQRLRRTPCDPTWGTLE